MDRLGLMHKGTRIAGRILSVTGLSALSALHAAWAAGSPWPAKNTEQLANAVVGQTVAMPAAAPTAIVAAGAAGASVLASGVLGVGHVQSLTLRALGTGLMLRAILGGDAALAALKLPPSSDKFRRLDNRYYRPFAAVLGVSLWLAAGDAKVSESL